MLNLPKDFGDKLETPRESEGVELSKLVVALIEEAKANGYDDYREYLIKTLDKDFEPDQFITSLFDDYLKCIMTGKKKDWGEGKWKEGDSFEDYLREKRIGYVENLENLKKERQERLESFPELPKMTEAYSDLKNMTGNNEVKFGPVKAGERPELAIYDFYEFLMRKALETIDGYFTGKVKILPKTSFEEETDLTLLSND